MAEILESTADDMKIKVAHSNETITNRDLSPEANAVSELPQGTSSIPTIEDYMERFQKVHQRRQDARKHNLEQVVEEDRVSKLPKNYEMRQLREQWTLEQMELKEEAGKRGEDYERLQALKSQANILRMKDIRRKMKTNPNTGFSDFEDMTLRQYKRLTDSIIPDMDSYKKMRETIGEADFYPTANTMIAGSHYPTATAMNKLTESVEAQQKKRDQYHRRRLFDPDAPIDHINERNRKFNRKLDRFYDKYTEDLRSDLDRGTAI